MNDPDHEHSERSAVEENEQISFLSSILESATEYSIVAMDLDGTIEAWNEGARRLHGHERKDVVGKANVSILRDPEEARTDSAVLEETLAKGKWSGDLRRVAKNGSKFTAHATITIRRDARGDPVGFTMISQDLTRSQPIERDLRDSRSADGQETVVACNATPFRSTDGHLEGVFAAARDIADRKHLEDQLTQRNRELTEATSFLNNVLESSTEYSIIAEDLGGIILTWNEGARRNYGYSAEEMVGKMNWRMLHVPEDVESGRVQALLDTAHGTGKAEGVFERVRKNGERFTASLAVTLRRDSAGAPIGFLLVSKDITEQQALEARLRAKNQELEEQYVRIQEANRLKSEFLANMSHELRTPLNSIIGFAELMHKKKVGPIGARHEEFLGDILTSARHLLQLINDVLDISKVESGRMEFQPEPVDLEQAVREVSHVVRNLVAQKRIELKSEIAPELHGVETDPAKLKQILYNYVSNALKFTPEGGRVTIRVLPEPPNAFRLEVEDTGIGIRPDDIGKLFAEFQQLDSSTSKKYPGTGLGLALTRRIVEAQGGSVGVHSIPDRGSTFFAVLPRHGGSPVPAPPGGQAERHAPAGPPDSPAPVASGKVHG